MKNMEMNIPKATLAIRAVLASCAIQNSNSPQIEQLVNPQNRTFNKQSISWHILLVLGVTFVLLLAVAHLFFAMESEFDKFRIERLSSTFGLAFLVIATALLLSKAGFFIFNLYRYFKYKPIASVSDADLPSCTVIVPAYNEGKQLYDTLMSLAGSDYPGHQLQILSIDDGSKDDTWTWMKKAKAILGNRLEIYQQPKKYGQTACVVPRFSFRNRRCICNNI